VIDFRQNKDLEFKSSEEINAYQNELIQKHVKYLAANSKFYKNRFQDYSVDPDSIRSISDLQNLPFTTKSDLENNNVDFLCVHPDQVVDLCQTSGTTGKPVSMLQTQQDVERLGYNEEISFLSTGITKSDRVIVGVAMGRNFMAGLAYFLGVTRIGATAIRIGAASTSLMIETIRTQKPTAIVCVPSLLLRIAGIMKENGYDPTEMGIKRLICIGEPIRNQDMSLSTLGQKLADDWKAKVYGTYASTEMATTFCDCEEGNGGHLHPDLIAVEIVDSEGKVVSAGKSGEVVATPFNITGMPLLRFRTGDIATLHTESCSCGRQSYRLGPIVGRLKQMLKIRGTTVYPPAIFDVLHDYPEITGSYIEVHNDFELSDRVVVTLGSDNPNISEEMVAGVIASRIRVKPEIKIVSTAEVRKKTIQEDKRKAINFFDYRKY
jgi:phenylacetate-CoA ligase